MSEEREASVQLLKTFAPLDGLKRDNLAALAKKVSVRTMAAGRVLFKEGDSDKRTVWVVGGMVELQEGSRTVAMIRGGTPEARNPLSPRPACVRSACGESAVRAGCAHPACRRGFPASRPHARWTR